MCPTPAVRVESGGVFARGTHFCCHGKGAFLLTDSLTTDNPNLFFLSFAFHGKKIPNEAEFISKELALHAFLGASFSTLNLSNVTQIQMLNIFSE